MATKHQHPEPKKRMTDEERQRIIQEVLCSQLQMLDQCMIGSTGLAVSRADDKGMPPGWTTGDQIKINFGWLSARSDEDLISIYGLNYHELSHVIMTPRLKGAFLAAFEGINLELCFNLMEDWRIEVHFSSMFSAAERYFNVMLRRLIIDDHVNRHRPPEQEWGVFAMLMGRFYVDPALRMRYELKFRKELDNSSRRMELLAARAKGLATDHWLTELEEHFQQVETHYQMPGLKSQFLSYLDLIGDARVDKMIDLARDFCSRRWIQNDTKGNREMILMVKAMTVLMPWERMNEAPMAGIPQAGNAANGGMLGPDIPTHAGMKEHELQEEAEEEAKRIIQEDKLESARLRKLAEENDPDAPEEDGPKAETAPEDEAGDEEEGEKDESKPGEDDLEDEDGSEQEGGLSGGPGAMAPSDSIMIDPTQRSEREKDEDDEEDSDEEDSETHEQPAGHLTGGAGSEVHDGEDQHLKQLTSDELAEIDKIFRDAGVIDQMLTEEINDILASKPVRQAIYSVRQALEEALGENLDLEPDLNNPFQQVPDTIMRERNRLQRQLEEIRGMLEGAWRDEQPAGKLLVRRLLNAPRSQYGSLFRSWIPDELEEAGIELVVLLDRSSSMASAIDHASQVCWMIASAVQETEGRVHVISFADPGKDEVLLSPARKLRNAQYQSFGTYGGTHAAEALKLAHKVIQSSNMPNKVVAIVTDGAWSDLQDAIPVIQQINNMDCETILMLVGLHMERDRRACTHVVHVNDMDRASYELRRVIERIGQTVVRRIAEERGYWNE
jgi:hypothetical protein